MEISLIKVVGYITVLNLSNIARTIRKGNEELKASMQYISQSFRIKNPEIKDLFLDIGAEELSHMEMVTQQ